MQMKMPNITRIITLVQTLYAVPFNEELSTWLASLDDFEIASCSFSFFSSLIFSSFSSISVESSGKSSLKAKRSCDSCLARKHSRCSPEHFVLQVELEGIHSKFLLLVGRRLATSKHRCVLQHYTQKTSQDGRDTPSRIPENGSMLTTRVMSTNESTHQVSG
jgi:hypothetical protein